MVRIKNLELRIKLLIPLFFILTALFLFIPSAYAQIPDIGQSQITPASPFYFLKSIREILELKFAGTARVKALRELEFATRRIREVKSLAGTSHQDLIEPTLARYLAQLQQLNSAANLSDETVAVQITESAILHMSVLQTIYPDISDPRAQMSIRAAINTLAAWDQDFTSKLNKLSKPHLVEKVLPSYLSACQFLAKVASSSALNEVEKAILLERAQKCLNPRI